MRDDPEKIEIGLAGESYQTFELLLMRTSGYTTRDFLDRTKSNDHSRWDLGIELPDDAHIEHQVTVRRTAEGSAC